MITVLLTILLQGSEKGRKLKQLALTDKKQTTFRCLLTTFQSALLLKQYNLNLPIKVETNTSKFAIVDILF